MMIYTKIIFLICISTVISCSDRSNDQITPGKDKGSVILSDKELGLKFLEAMNYEEEDTIDSLLKAQKTLMMINEDYPDYEYRKVISNRLEFVNMKLKQKRDK